METEAEAAKESRVEMLNRHQKETKSLRERELEMKKTAAKGSKAEQKAKKKAVEEEIAALDAKMKEQHAQELASLGFVADENSQSGQLDVLVKAIAGVAVSGAAGAPAAVKPSKGKKWRDKRAQKEAEREQRIQEEQNNVVSARMVEEEHLARKLQPLGLSLKEIKPDGHCLYRALEDQLSLHPGCEKHSYEQLRKIAAGYIRSHSEDFLPFIGNEGGIEEYCSEIESTAAWGGQLELEALSHGLRKHIIVFSVNMDNVEMGKEYGDEPTLKLSYHKHAYGLGEHYNSVVPVEQD